VTVTAAAIALLLTLAGQASPAYEQRLEQWRRQRTVEVAGPEGWATVVALHWLQPGVTRVGSGEGVEVKLTPPAPALLGRVRVEGRSVTFDAAPGVAVASQGARVTSIAMRPDETRLEAGSCTLVVIERAGKLALRVRDRESAARKRFKGIAAFPVSARFRIRARFVPFDPPRTATVVNVIGDPVDFVSPGQIVFTLDGAEHRLDALYETAEKKDLWVIFRDRTSGTTTYPAGRYLHVPLPAGGIVDLDFNFAYNPPCAFTEFATCPIPPRQNWLKVAIEAGEKDYHP
jgi:uncharacterized protein (DUF1684 family)